jgi:hypothetical protein
MPLRCPVNSTRVTQSQISEISYMTSGWGIKVDTARERVILLISSSSEESLIGGFAQAYLKPVLDSNGVVHILTNVEMYGIKAHSEVFYIDDRLLVFENFIKDQSTWGKKRTWSFFRKDTYGSNEFFYFSTCTWMGLYWDQKAIVADTFFVQRMPANLTRDQYLSLDTYERRKLKLSPPSPQWHQYISRDLIYKNMQGTGKIILTLEGEI